jgi:hypothetical protein
VWDAGARSALNWDTKQMKTKLTILFCALTSVAEATLIDLTPGGTTTDIGPPPFVASNGFYDQAAFGFFDGGTVFYQGWVSAFGILNGGQYFFTDLFNQATNPTTANVWWDFGDSGYWMMYIDVVGWDGDGSTGLVANLYQVQARDAFSSQDVVTLDGIQHITGISFYGRNPAIPLPDTGTTIGLLLFGFLILASGQAYKGARQ